MPYISRIDLARNYLFAKYSEFSDKQAEMEYEALKTHLSRNPSAFQFKSWPKEYLAILEHMISTNIILGNNDGK